MRNHDQKTRDMARSILPSTARHISRKRKKGAARRARARNTARLGRLIAQLHDLDGFEEPLHRYDLDDEGWDGMVEDRRAADKVAPVIRWTQVRIERDARLAEGDYWVRRNHFAALLGDTTIGRHALQHLDHLFGEENAWAYGSYPGRPTWQEIRERRRAEDRAEQVIREQMLEEVLASADAGRLNSRIVALTPPIEHHWTIDADGSRVPARPSGFEPWRLDGSPDRWLEVDARGPTDAQLIAYRALSEVHAEMFGARER